MKKIISGVLLAVLMIGYGCSGDDAIIDPPPPPAAAPRVVVFSAASAPPLDTVGHALWNSVTETAIDISDIISPKVLVRNSSSLSDSVYVKAIRYNDSLYLRVRWNDATNDIVKDPFKVVVSGPPVFFSRDILSFKEDHLLFMFANSNGSSYDTWHWRSLTTGYGFLAAGETFDGTILIDDASNTNLQPARLNPKDFGTDQPLNVHKDSSEFNGPVLYLPDIYPRQSAVNDSGWTFGQVVPGWIIDTTLYKRSASERLSRWDIRAAFTYSSGQYTVMMCRPMNTGYSDDIDLTGVDSLQFKIGLLDFQDNLELGGTRRGFTGDFWIIM